MSEDEATSPITEYNSQLTLPTDSFFRSDKNTLMIHDGRTGRDHVVKIGEGPSVKATDFQKIKDDAGNGLRVFDPSYANTAVVRSAISFVDGERGILEYRGYPIEELAEKSTFLEVSFLLIYGELPTKVRSCLLCGAQGLMSCRSNMRIGGAR